MKQQLQLDFSSTENNSSDEFHEKCNMAADSKYPKKPDIVIICKGVAQLFECSRTRWTEKALITQTVYTKDFVAIVTGFVTRVTRRVPLMERKLLARPEHLNHQRFSV